MEVIWAPWRMEYILQEDKTKECIFCVARNESPSVLRDRLILRVGPASMVVMNRFPYNNGHLLVAPLKHARNLEDLSHEEMMDMMRTVRDSISILKTAMQPEGFNVGMNLGLVAGAGIPEHLHVHIVPRWCGDTSYMAVVGETRVIPEHLNATYEKLRPYFAELFPGGEP